VKGNVTNIIYDPDSQNYILKYPAKNEDRDAEDFSEKDKDPLPGRKRVNTYTQGEK